MAASPDVGGSGLEANEKGPEKIRAATQRRLLGAFSLPRLVSYPGGTVHAVDVLLRGLDTTQHDAVTSRAAPRG